MDSDIINLLLLPLLGGYIFCTRCAWTAFAARIADGQRLIYSSSVAGVLLLTAARGLELLLATAQRVPGRVDIWISSISCAGEIATIAAGIPLFLLGFAPRFDSLSQKKYRVAGLAMIVVPACLLIGWGQFHLTIWRFVAGIGAIVLVMSLLTILTAFVVRITPHSDNVVPVRVFLLVPSIIAASLLVLKFGPVVAAKWPEFSSIKYSGLALLSAVLGATLWIPANVLFTNRWAWSRAHESGRTSGLERLLYRAFKAAMPVQLTLKDGKVYTGLILELPVPITRIEGGCIEFLPMSSGFRDPKTKDVSTTTNYAKVIADLTKPAAPATPQPANQAQTATGGQQPQGSEPPTFRAPPEVRQRLASLMKAVPLSEIQVASMYDRRYKKADFMIP